MTEYPHGCRVMIPAEDFKEATVLTFKGAFGRRKLRRMLRKCLLGVSDKRILDALIDHCSQRLQPVAMGDLITALEDTDDEEAEASASIEGSEPPVSEAGS